MSKANPTRQDRDTEVLVIGAGPVGVTLALDLASRGVSVTVAETRYRGEPPRDEALRHSSRALRELWERLSDLPEAQLVVGDF